MNKETLKQTVLRHLISFAITFLSSFFVSLGATIGSTLDLNQLTLKIIVATVLSLARMALKLAFEASLKS